VAGESAEPCEHRGVAIEQTEEFGIGQFIGDRSCELGGLVSMVNVASLVSAVDAVSSVGSIYRSVS